MTFGLPFVNQKARHSRQICQHGLRRASTLIQFFAHFALKSKRANSLWRPVSRATLSLLKFDQMNVRLFDP